MKLLNSLIIKKIKSLPTLTGFSSFYIRTTDIQLEWTLCVVQHSLSSGHTNRSSTIYKEERRSSLDRSSLAETKQRPAGRLLFSMLTTVWVFQKYILRESYISRSVAATLLLLLPIDQSHYVNQHFSILTARGRTRPHTKKKKLKQTY